VRILLVMVVNVLPMVQIAGLTGSPAVQHQRPRAGEPGGPGPCLPHNDYGEPLSRLSESVGVLRVCDCQVCVPRVCGC
jgi:hypothetical protein